MTKKIIKVKDEKKSKKNLDLGSIASVVMENKDAVGKIVDGIEDIINNQNNKNTKKTTNKKSSSKKNVNKKSKSDLENLIDLAGKVLK